MPKGKEAIERDGWRLVVAGRRRGEEEFEEGAVIAIQVGDCEVTISTGKNPTFRALVEVVVLEFTKPVDKCPRQAMR
jgi:hypothetical protein